MKKTLFALLLIPGLTFAQTKTTGELLKETTKVYLDAEHLSMDVNVYTYATVNDQGILMGSGQIRKSGENYYSKFLADELIVNGNCTVVLDHSEKTITWYDAENTKKRKDKKQELPNLDSISNGDSIVYKGVENGQRRFLFYSRGAMSAIHTTEVLINDQTHFVERIVYYYRDNSNDEAYDMHKVVIDYVNISTDKPEESFFSEKKYLTYSKGQPTLNISFSRYKLIIAE